MPERVEVTDLETIGPTIAGAIEADCLVVALGYEERARYIAEAQLVLAEKRLAIGFPHQQELSFEQNRQLLTGRRFQIEILEDAEVAAIVCRLVRAIQSERAPRIVVDVSSFSRLRLAQIIDILRSEAKTREIDVVLLYALAQFSPPPTLAGVVTHAGPVLRSFAGWPRRPGGPCFGIVGLGYEEDRALGALEYIQAAAAWLFFPRSKIEEYEPVTQAANELLIRRARRDSIIDYQVEHPASYFAKLSSLCGDLSRRGVPILLTFGPKMFAAVSLVVGCVFPEVGVWRVSSGEWAEPEQRKAAGVVCGLSFRFKAVTQRIDAEVEIDDGEI